MTALRKARLLSEEEYLTIERAASFKSEFVDGEMFAMAGAGRRHVLISSNIGGQLYMQFRNRPCQSFVSDMRLRVADSGMYTYPDVVAVCGEPRFLDEQGDILLNPQLIVEVLSPSTKDYDRGEKLFRYRQLESLTDYVFVSQDQMLVEHGSREPAMPDVWTILKFSQPADLLRLASIECVMSLQDIYEKVEFPKAEPLPSR